MKIFIDFNIPDRAPWHKDQVFAPTTVVEILESIKEFRAEIHNYINWEFKNEEIIEGFQSEYKLHYIRECLVGERNIPQGSTIIIVENLLNDNAQIPEHIIEHPEKARKKAQNIWSVVDRLFPDVLHKDFNIDDLTPEMIKSIHKIVMNGLLENAGKYRLNSAMPSPDPSAPWESKYQYMSPVQIKQELEELCWDVQKKVKVSTSFTERVKIASSFLSLFLHIHPFSNGNGRVARLLVSLLLSRDSIVPVILYSLQSGRDHYLDCLKEARKASIGANFLPDTLARFLLENIEKSHWLVFQALALGDSEPME